MAISQRPGASSVHWRQSHARLAARPRSLSRIHAQGRPGRPCAGALSRVFARLLLLAAGALAFTSLCPEARADPSLEVAGATGFGALLAGVGPARFTLGPSASVSLRGERGFLVVRDTLSLVGLTGGRLGVDNETTLGGGFFWELVNVSAGLSLVAFSLPLCGPRLCGQVRGLAPGASVRLDLFGPFLSRALGLSVDCAGAWVTGSAAPVWSGVSLRCSAGPVLRFTTGP
jgi:hypothetical protein